MVSIPGDQLKFDLEATVLFDFLKRMRPEGYPCPICFTKAWGLNIHPEVRDGKKTQIVYPDGVLPMDGKAPSTPQELTDYVHRYSTKQYSFACTNCGYVISFHAGIIAARTAQRRMEAENGKV